MRYAKLIDNYPQYAPRTVIWRGCTVINPDGEKLQELGYLPVIETPFPAEEPAEGFAWAESWTEEDGQIVRVWVQEAVPPEEPSAEELLEIILGGEEA